MLVTDAWRSRTGAAIVMAALAGTVQAQNSSIKGVVGTWTLVSATVERGDKTFEPYGPNPKGLFMLDEHGRFAFIVTRSSLPIFASNNRETGTAEENKAIVQGSNAYFGRYSINESEGVIEMHIEAGTFPNWNGTRQKRLFAVADDQLTLTVPTVSIGAGRARLLWKKAR